MRTADCAAVAAGAGSVMCAYNKVNGLFSCENPDLLSGILRGSWGFRGFVVSDYGANHSTQASLTAGLDIEFLSTWSTQDDWIVAGGARPIEVGASSRDLRLRGTAR